MRGQESSDKGFASCCTHLMLEDRLAFRAHLDLRAAVQSFVPASTPQHCNTSSQQLSLLVNFNHGTRAIHRRSLAQSGDFICLCPL
jgi:hypothetical protein